ncbi:Glycosyl phosphatidyl inositol protein transamidase complex subunit [Puccinia graminis f. sp. tritici]|uniref:Glycosyl phosphatidyl inositol protein transamidase complex subunit n=2 Tax=Puccinia graminis f. sp. tritici TaxID=56615 RepID=E3K9B4_PUCGT|nr:uncharacterized protein PGTG_07118 [Puccinia graminis f. sp. tritici CRL 75-36-700-3]EFP80866.2 hypothetical protein PGTG_07118 [Puccinia graminis f. sp. tritici CRL 75-36-700-3]KAA1068789.1 Glycosyl phosphatidyl inositol protein transamidase complex subunit [Puccinia graminis f. sp. tritici]
MIEKELPEEQEEEEEEEDQESISLSKRFNRRQLIINFIFSYAPQLSSLLILAGYLAGFILPTDLLSRSTYLSENAILPGQVNTYWSWAQVHKADRYADLLDEWRDLPSEQRASHIAALFQGFGLRSQTQSYTFSSLGSQVHSISNGTNVHAILHAPRVDGSEALVLMASWLTRRPGSDIHGGDINLRGVASVLALAEYLISFNLWSKDIIFLIADEYLEGTHAWLKAYHGLSQPNLKMQPLDLKTGSIWAALNIDFPFHSFSHIGIDYEGINGQLPNLDLINTVSHIVRWTGSCPVTMHHEPLEPSYPSYLPDHPEVQKYIQAGRTIVKQMSHGLVGSPSGPEGLFSTYRIDAIALFAHPADGPHGFHTIGNIVESSLRSLNNLLERLHQSFFLYLLQSEARFLSVAMYLIVPLLIGVGLTIRGLAKWGATVKDWNSLSPSEGHQNQNSKSFEKRPVTDQRGNEKGAEILWSLRVAGITHLVGAMIYLGLIRSIEPTHAKESVQLYVSILIFAILPLAIIKLLPPRRVSSVAIFEPIQLMLSGCFISVISVLNFPLGTGIGFALSIHPLVLLFSLLALALFGHLDISKLVHLFRNDQVLDAWFLPFVAILFLPLFVQSLLVRLLKAFY